MAPIMPMAAKLADHGAQSQGTTSHRCAAATARNSISQYMTDIHSQVWGEGQGTAAEFWQQKIITNGHSAITDSIGHISSSVTSFYRMSVFQSVDC